MNDPTLSKIFTVEFTVRSSWQQQLLPLIFSKDCGSHSEANSCCCFCVWSSLRRIFFCFHPFSRPFMSNTEDGDVSGAAEDDDDDESYVCNNHECNEAEECKGSDAASAGPTNNSGDKVGEKALADALKTLTKRE